MARDYDSTVARIAGNILSGMVARVDNMRDHANVTVAVNLARLIVEETKRTESRPDPPVKEPR